MSPPEIESMSPPVELTVLQQYLIKDNSNISDIIFKIIKFNCLTFSMGLI